MQYIFSSLSFGTYPAFCKSNVGRNFRIQVVTYHNHIEQLSLGIDTERQRRIGRRRKYICQRSHLQQVGSVSATGTFSMISMNRTSIDSSDRIFHISAFVQRIGVNSHLNVEFIRYSHRSPNSSRSTSPVFMNFKTTSTG